MLSTEAIVAICTVVGTSIGTFGGIIASQKLTNFRLKQLEDKVSKHNNLVERIALAEKDISFLRLEIAELKS